MIMLHIRPFILGTVLVSVLAIANLPGQAPAPQVYSLTTLSKMTEASMFTGRETTVKIYRNGSKELVEMVLAPQGSDSTGVHTRSLFDLDARKVYIQDLVNNTCSWMRYVSAEMPSHDPIAASAAGAAEIAKQKTAIVGKESINGIPARIVEIPGPPQQGKSRIWIAENGNFFVKMEMTGPDGKAMTMLEVKQVSFSKPSDSFFIPPESCTTQAQGEMSSSGFSAHAESSVEARVSGSADLKTNQAKGEAQPGTSKPNPASGLPDGTTVQAAYEDGTSISFKPQEQVAFLFVQTIKSMESRPCVSAFKRLCSMDELVQGVKGKIGGGLGFKRNPTQEADYEYRLTFFGQPPETASRYQLEVIPKRPGIGGFLFTSDKVGFSNYYFNPNGPATVNDKKLGSYGSGGDDFRAR